MSKSEQTLRRHAVELGGLTDGQPMMFAHGYGCDQNMSRLVTPAFADTHRLVLFDHISAWRSDLTVYDDTKYASLDGYTTDVLTIVRALDLHM